MNDPVMQVADLVNDLTEPVHHKESLDSIAAAVRKHTGHPSPKRHDQVFPCLIDQLRIAITWDGSQGDGPQAKANPESSGPGNEDALDVLVRIEQGVAQWIAGEGRQDVKDRMRGLVGMATVVGVDDLYAMRRDLSSWRAWARVETGWDRRSFTADVACPCCEHRSLRVRGDGTAARCSNCQAAWSEDRDLLPSVYELGAAIEKRTSDRRHAEEAVRDSA